MPVQLVPRRKASIPPGLALKGVAIAAFVGTAACQSAPAAHSGFLSSYDGLAAKTGGTRSPVQRRDDVASDQVSRVYSGQPCLYRTSRSVAPRAWVFDR